MKKVMITGITGQDGSYLSELLLEKGYEVHGVIRRHSTPCTERIDHLLSDAQYDERIFLHYGDLTDSSNAHTLIREIQPDEVYNLAAQSHVAVSFEVPEYTAEATGVGTIRLLEAVRQVKPDARFYQASTSELFGGLLGGVRLARVQACERVGHASGGDAFGVGCAGDAQQGGFSEGAGGAQIGVSHGHHGIGLGSVAVGFRPCRIYLGMASVMGWRF